VLDVYPYASTSPIYVIVGGRPIRSRPDAEYFIAWIERLQSAARESSAWNTTQEKTQVLGDLEQARAVFESRRKE